MSDVLDPSGFQIAVVLRSGGDSFPLWMGGGLTKGDSTIYYPSDVAGNDVLFEDIPIVASVQVDIGMGLIGKISVEISATYDMGLRLLESSLFAIGSVLDVQIGYPRISRFLPWFSAMTAKPSITISPDDGLQATLNGEGGAFAAARGGSSETFTGTYATIIETIANQDSNKWNLDLPDPPTEGAGEDPLYIERASVSQENRTDWMFVQYICRMANCDCWIMPDPDVQGANLLRVRRRGDALGGTPKPYTFVSRGQCNFIKTFPVLTFESSAEGVWLPPRELRTTDVNIRTRQTPPETSVRPEDVGVAALPGDTTPGEGAEESEGTVVATEPTPRDARGAGRRVVLPVHAPENPLEVLQSMATEGRQHGGLNATFTTIGIPDIFPGEVVKLVGLGIFSGNYVVESVSHSAQPGDWSMTVKLLGDSVDSRGLETAISRTWDIYNQEPVEEQEESGGGGTISVDAVPAG